jgi:AmpD protein
MLVFRLSSIVNIFVRYSLDPDTGLLHGARQVPSPNADERPPGCTIDALIIHAISLPPREYGNDFIERFFQNRLPREVHPYFEEIHDVCVSAHFLIRRNGEIVQFVPVNKRAWHAGVSVCMGREAANDFSIGIELEGCDDMGFEESQYESLETLSRALIDAIPTLSGKHVYGHSDIAPGRKTDPGPHFDWQRYRQALAKTGPATTA